MVAILAGAAVSWLLYLIYCICLLPLQAVRRIVFQSGRSLLLRTTVLLSYSAVLSTTLVLSIVNMRN